MLIIEGTDGVGKTTLAKRLVQELQKRGPWVYTHFTKLPDCWRFPDDYVPHIIRHVVRDRFHMSDVAYRYARGEAQRFTEHTYLCIDARVRLVGGMTVVIFADSEARLRQNSGPHQMHSYEQHRRADDMYRRLVAKREVECAMTYHLKDTGPWPAEDDKFVKEILREYLARQDAFETQAVR